MATKLLPYKMASRSAALLAQALGISRINVASPSYLNRQSNMILNWGSSAVPVWHNTRGENTEYYNHPQKVAIASNKLATFQQLSNHDIPTVDWTDNRDQALEWLVDGYQVIERTLLNSHSGGGIIVRQPTNNEDLIEVTESRSRLFTKYMKKRHEFRVHVLDDHVFDVQEKRRQQARDHNAVESLVRSHANGWNFCRDGLPRLDDVAFWDRLETLAVQAIRALGLDFGAVDIIYNQHYDAFYVLEVNTAVGLEGQTLQNYVSAIRRAGWV